MPIGLEFRLPPRCSCHVEATIAATTRALGTHLILLDLCLNDRIKRDRVIKQLINREFRQEG
jgi:hypothetical protein